MTAPRFRRPLQRGAAKGLSSRGARTGQEGTDFLRGASLFPVGWLDSRSLHAWSAAMGRHFSPPRLPRFTAICRCHARSRGVSPVVVAALALAVGRLLSQVGDSFAQPINATLWATNGYVYS